MTNQKFLSTLDSIRSAVVDEATALSSAGSVGLHHQKGALTRVRANKDGVFVVDVLLHGDSQTCVPSLRSSGEKSVEFKLRRHHVHGSSSMSQEWESTASVVGVDVSRRAFACLLREFEKKNQTLPPEILVGRVMTGLLDKSERRAEVQREGVIVMRSGDHTISGMVRRDQDVVVEDWNSVKADPFLGNFQRQIQNTKRKASRRDDHSR